MFWKTARFYDKVYAFKDYEAETQTLLDIIGQDPGSDGKRLLDVACGTGHHLEHLKRHFDVEGMDISSEMVEIASQRNPGIRVFQGDMINFDLGCKFNVITCLFSSIGYVKTLDNVRKAAKCMTNHLVPGGLLIIEPWLTPDNWKSGTVHGMYIDEPELKIARVNTSFVEERMSYFDLHYLIGTPEGTEHFVERHELGLFETEEIDTILTETGLEVTYDPEGLIGRGLFIGKRQ